MQGDDFMADAAAAFTKQAAEWKQRALDAEKALAEETKRSAWLEVQNSRVMLGRSAAEAEVARLRWVLWEAKLDLSYTSSAQPIEEMRRQVMALHGRICAALSPTKETP